jgi:hypothetical protein
MGSDPKFTGKNVVANMIKFDDIFKMDAICGKEKNISHKSCKNGTIPQ